MSFRKIKIISLIVGISFSSYASDKKNFVQINGGFSFIVDNELLINNSNEELDLKSGYMMGIGVGRNFSENFSMNIFYRLDNIFHDGVKNDGKDMKGNLFSNILGVSAYYNLPLNEKISPYIGVSALFAKKIELDYAENTDNDYLYDDNERNYTNRNEFGYGLEVGSIFKINEIYSFSTSIDYVSFDKINLTSNKDNENNNMKYDILSFKIGMRIKF